MTKFQIAHNKMWKWALLAMFVTGLGVFAASPAFSGKDHKYETIEASAMGTGTQLGQVIAVQIEIYAFSTEEDRQALIGAFEKGQNQGLVNALTKMKAVGHCSITGTLGYDVSFIRNIQTPTGGKIRFVTEPPATLRRSVCRHPIAAFNLTGGGIASERHGQEKEHGRFVSGRSARHG